MLLCYFGNARFGRNFFLEPYSGGVRYDIESQAQIDKSTEPTQSKNRIRRRVLILDVRYIKIP